MRAASVWLAFNRKIRTDAAEPSPGECAEAQGDNMPALVHSCQQGLGDVSGKLGAASQPDLSVSVLAKPSVPTLRPHALVLQLVIVLVKAFLPSTCLPSV